MATIEYDGTATWNYWTTLAGSSTNLATSNTWTIWSDGTGNTANIVYRTEPVQPHVPTAEEQVAQVERTRVLAAEEHERIVKRKEAERKADELLLSVINRRQRREYKTKNQITIFAGQKPKYILQKRESYNVVECDDCGRPVQQHCVQTRGTPLADQLATQYLYLHTNPAELLGVANHRPA